MKFCSQMSVLALCATGAMSLGGCDARLLGEGAEADSGARNGMACERCSDSPGAFGEEPVGVEGVGWSTRFPRLSHTQWENTVNDLLLIENASELSGGFALDPDSAAFDTSNVLTVSSNLWSDYQRAAESLAWETVSQPERLAAILPSSGERSAQSFLENFGRRAFRRPLSPEELNRYLQLFENGKLLMGGDDAFVDGVELVVRAMLQSPHFLYRVEDSVVATGERIWLSDYEIASRLSYALWNTMPSADLLAAAQAGGLSSREGVESWARKMLSDERAAATLLSFHEQLFHIEQYGTVAKNATLFPGFTPELAPVLQHEATLFFEHVSVLEDRGITELFTSNVTFVNEITAPYYGLSVAGGEMSRVELDSEQRSGILTQLGFLSRYGSQTQSDPILRGVHLSLELLCSDLPPPPDNLPPLPMIDANQTNRQRVEETTGVQPCAACHENYINPLGFAFENYNAVGQWRDVDNGQAVDAADTFVIDGQEVAFENAIELTRLLAESDELHRCYAQKWLEYAIGRAPSKVEVLLLDQLGETSRRETSLRELLVSLVALDTFRARPPESVK